MLVLTPLLERVLERCWFQEKDMFLSWFEMWVDVQDLSTFLTDGKQTAIGKWETLVVSMALMIWCQLLEIGATHGLH